jgi:predicted permease
VNVAHLFMARGLARSREMAVRRALGAGTPAVAGQLLVESLLTAAGGGIIGILVAALGVRAFLAIDPLVVPRAAVIAVDPRVLTIAAILCTLTAVAFGLLPSLWALARNPGDALRSDGRGATGGRDALWLRDGLVMVEVALSLVLVFSAGLVTRGFLRLGGEPLGFRVADVWTIRVGLPDAGGAAAWKERMERMADALRSVPDVRSVTYGLSVPLEHVGGTCCWSRPVAPADADQGSDATIHPYAGQYVDVFEPLILAGRPWSEEEATSAPAPALLNERAARALFGSVDGALGREIAIGTAGHLVVGVTAEDRHYGLYREHGRALYVPVESVPFVPDRLTLAVRMQGAADDVPRRLREAVWSVEPQLPLPLVRSMSEWARAATARTRFDWWLFTTFGTAALLLAAAGLYGTLLYTVGLNRRELGIRLALGAGRRSVEARVLGRGLRTTAAGLVPGAVGAAAAGRLLENRLPGVEAGDPVTLFAALAVLLSTAAVASWLPARRAGATDPVETLRQDQGG